MKSPLALVALVAGQIACGYPPVAMGPRSEPEPSTTCPFGVRGARVQMRDVEGGVALELRAFGDVAEVRRRARDAAAMYGPGAHRGLGHGGEHGKGQQHGLGLGRLGVPVVAEVEDTKEGARIVVRPRSPADLSDMRLALAEREARARRADCR